MGSTDGMVVAAGLVADESVITGYPPHRMLSAPGVIGPDARLRSGTVVYAGSTIGARLETGHNVVIREDVRIGEGVSIWSNSVVDYGCVIGDRVKIHANCYVAQFTELEDDVFLAPGVTIANDLYPGNQRSADSMAGPLIRAGAQIGVNVTVLPYVTIGRGAIVGAGAVVTRDVPEMTVAYGNPAVPVAAVPDGRRMEARLRAGLSSRYALRDVSPSQAT
jgi:acetyltransferase-like isoleucine patch superfamily enzyme